MVQANTDTASLLLSSEMAVDAGLPEISWKFQICPVNPVSLSDNLSDNLKVELIVC